MLRLTGRIALDVALLQLSRPAAQGYCTLGTSVDAAMAAALSAGHIVAEIKQQMPQTLGHRRLGAILDPVVVMTNTTIAVIPESGRKLMNPPLPRWEISGPVAKKLPNRVLVVDDEPLIRWSVSETLTGLGLAVVQAGDAASALASVTAGGRDAFDLILLDLRLPDMRDLSLLGTLKQLQPEASIILMTAFGSDEVVEQAIARGVEAILHKPFELGTLVDAVYGIRS